MGVLKVGGFSSLSVGLFRAMSYLEFGLSAKLTSELGAQVDLEFWYGGFIASRYMEKLRGILAANGLVGYKWIGWLQMDWRKQILWPFNFLFIPTPHSLPNLEASIWLSGCQNPSLLNLGLHPAHTLRHQLTGSTSTCETER